MVARDFKVKGDGREFDVFASMPPLEAKRLLFRMAMVKGSVGDDELKGSVKLMFLDVKKAHLNGKLKEDEVAYVELPPEAGGGVGRLKRWLYGMRNAASAWERDFAEKLVEEAGFVRGRAAPATFVQPTAGVRLVVWGDDFTFLGRDLDLKAMARKMGEWYQVKVRGFVGPDPEDLKEIRILNRTIRWSDSELTYEADEKHVQTVIREVGLDGLSKGSDSPLPKAYEAVEEDQELHPEKAMKYRRIAATVNYLALDRVDLQFAAGVLGRTAARPTERSWANLKKVARYLISVPTVLYRYRPSRAKVALKVVAYSDSDWAGCRSTRRSVSGGILTVGGGLIKAWSNRQASVALSSAEAEFYAATKTTAEAIGIKSLMEDLGWSPAGALEVRMDASAAKAMASRRGIGRTRHLEVRHLWIQEAVDLKKVTLSKIHGLANPADILTKPKAAKEMWPLLSALYVGPQPERRVSSALSLAGSGRGGVSAATQETVGGLC